MNDEKITSNAPLTLAEYLDQYDPYEPDKLGPYDPEDNAVILYTTVKLYQERTSVGFIDRAGHITAASLLEEPMVWDIFQRQVALEEMGAEIIHCRYGSGTAERRALPAEMLLAHKGALRTESSGPALMTIIRRGDLELAPVSPLTERGMSKFFTAVAELAERSGLEVGGIDPQGQLQLFRHGAWAFSIDESGSGRMSMREYMPILSENGVTGDIVFSNSTPLKKNWLFLEIQSLRREIPEMLYPSDYPLIPKEAPEQQTGSMEMSL